MPEKLAPAVNVEPLLNVMPLASPANNLCAIEPDEAEKVIFPEMLPVNPLKTLIVTAFAALTFKIEPEATSN